MLYKTHGPAKLASFARSYQKFACRLPIKYSAKGSISRTVVSTLGVKQHCPQPFRQESEVRLRNEATEASTRPNSRLICLSTVRVFWLLLLQTTALVMEPAHLSQLVGAVAVLTSAKVPLPMRTSIIQIRFELYPIISAAERAWLDARRRPLPFPP